MLEELSWISGEEQQRIDGVRSILAGKLPDDCPEDFVHDLAIARFLRGNDNDPEVAAEKYGRSLEYRRNLIAGEPFKGFRERQAGATAMDLSALPSAEEVTRCLPVRSLVGDSADGLPVLCMVPRLLDLEGMDALSDECLGSFVRAQLEQRWMVLHNLSMQQKRMVKFVEVRDLNGASMTNLVMNGSRLITRMLNMLSGLQDFYPEVIHQVFVLNAPSTFQALFDVISPFLNARMLAKIKVHPVGLAFNEIATMLSARAVWSWISQTTSHLKFDGLVVESGSQEYTARWLDEQQPVAWSVSLEDGSGVLFKRAFLPAPIAGKTRAPTCAEEQISAGQPATGSFTPDVPGVFLLCVDNTSAWWSSRTFTLTVSA